MTDQADAHELNQEQLEALFVGAHERRQQPARHDDMDRIAARAAPLRREAAEIATPPGYRIAESGIPGVPPKYQVLLAARRDEQFIGMRDSREEATGLAICITAESRPSEPTRPIGTRLARRRRAGRASSSKGRK